MDKRERIARYVAVGLTVALAAAAVKKHAPQLFEPESAEDRIARLEYSATKSCNIPFPYDQLCAMEKERAQRELQAVRDELKKLK